MNWFDFFNFFSPAHNEKRQADAALCGRGERPKNGADALSCLSDVYKNGTRAKRRQADVPLCGRSMIEMLGVLAIIGVLSVGAMSGYAKAMFKYKLNKQAESMNMLFVNAFQILRELDNTSSSGNAVYFTETMYKLNLVPDGIKFDSRRPLYLYDIFGNKIWIYAYPSIYGMGYDFDPGHDGMEICRNMFNVYKQNADILYYISTDRFVSNDEGESEYEKGKVIYGNSYCSKSYKCLRDTSMSDIDTFCHNCLEDSSRCRLYAIWK